MKLRPLLIDEDKSQEIFANPDCQEIFKSYPNYYYETGYNPPWIGYFVIRDDKVVGVCGFVGAPKEGRVEIAYGTFKQHESQGIASYGCRELMAIATSVDPQIIITAKTAPEENASVKILKRNGFVFTGVVQDDGIGDAWEWVYRNSE